MVELLDSFENLSNYFFKTHSVVLLTIAENNGNSIIKIYREAKKYKKDIHYSTVHTCIGELLALSLVELKARDGRTIEVYLTEKGEEITRILRKCFDFFKKVYENYQTTE